MVTKNALIPKDGNFHTITITATSILHKDEDLVYRFGGTTEGIKLDNDVEVTEDVEVKYVGPYPCPSVNHSVLYTEK